jgi:hypothetical protein
MDTPVYACERCREFFVGDPYRVISEADGERLLDMTVCYGCYLEASQLGLHTENIPVREFVFH